MEVSCFLTSFLTEFSDVKPPQLPRALPPRRTIDHQIELDYFPSGNASLSLSLALVLALLLTGLALSKEKDSLRRVIELKKNCSKRHSSLAATTSSRPIAHEGGSLNWLWKGIP